MTLFAVLLLMKFKVITYTAVCECSIDFVYYYEGLYYSCCICRIWN